MKEQKTVSDVHFDLIVNRAKREILDDIKSGLVPEDIKHFYDLDSYVDCNYYGGFCDETYKPSENYEFENRVQTALDDWLKNGRMD